MFPVLRGTTFICTDLIYRLFSELITTSFQSRLSLCFCTFCRFSIKEYVIHFSKNIVIICFVKIVTNQTIRFFDTVFDLKFGNIKKYASNLRTRLHAFVLTRPQNQEFNGAVSRGFCCVRSVAKILNEFYQRRLTTIHFLRIFGTRSIKT